MNAERTRLQEAIDEKHPWRKWGPYLSERQWGTVREDYSDSGDAWNYFTHDQARSRIYRWGEDGLAGISDEKQRLCFSVAMWNGKDAILKERLFGLTNSEGNHGEDVKEYYFYLDSTPTHSYMKYLYKYPQRAYPYEQLVKTNQTRSRCEMEYELLDTQIFAGNEYFDVFVEYAKAGPEDVCIQVTAHNRGPETATIHLLPTLWFRNMWWADQAVPRPMISRETDASGEPSLKASHSELGDYFLRFDPAEKVLFTDNETNIKRVANVPNHDGQYFKDAFHNYIIQGKKDAVNPSQRGTKAAVWYMLTIDPGCSKSIRLRLSGGTSALSGDGNPGSFASKFDAIMRDRRQEADEFYASVIPPNLTPDAANVMRQAMAGMLWSKQFYYYDVNEWMRQRGADPFKNPNKAPRNTQWHHMLNADIISMPDKWEYPWYAAWDLAFHVLAVSLVDEDFAKRQLDLMLGESYMHPSGQMPAYEWNFGDVNPPVHAWSTIFMHRLMQAKTGKPDLLWLERSFHKLMLNFTWWVNRKDRLGNNVFNGGFLGLDNIGVFDRSAPLPTGGCLEQADGTAWMALYCQNMTEIAVELAMHNPSYSDICLKFITHSLWIMHSLLHAGSDVGMWDEEDGFFYDVLRLPDGKAQRLKVRSMVGLLPLCATTVFDQTVFNNFPEAQRHMQAFLADRPELQPYIIRPPVTRPSNFLLASVLDENKLRRVLSKMLDENEFFGPYGIRALSRYHQDHPFVFGVDGQQYRVSYLPAESDTGMFGGNSNWRGPVWMPVNGLIIRALMMYYTFYGDDFKIECPTGSGRMMTLYQVAEELARRLSSIFLRDHNGRRPVYGGTEKFQTDEHWRDLILFYEYFHGDNGAGLGASHQTGWTGIVARIMHLFATTSPQQIAEMGKMAALVELQQPAGVSPENRVASLLGR